MTPPAFARMSGTTRIWRWFRISLASGVVGPHAASMTIDARTSPAFSAVIASSSAAGTNAVENVGLYQALVFEPSDPWPLLVSLAHYWAGVVVLVAVAYAILGAVTRVRAYSTTPPARGIWVGPPGGIPPLRSLTVGSASNETLSPGTVFTEH